MKPYQLRVAARASKELEALPKDVRNLLIRALEGLMQDPRPRGAKKILGRDGYRIRQGRYRILYTISYSKKVVSIYRIGHRRDVYRNL